MKIVATGVEYAATISLAAPPWAHARRWPRRILADAMITCTGTELLPRRRRIVRRYTILASSLGVAAATTGEAISTLPAVQLRRQRPALPSCPCARSSREAAARFPYEVFRHRHCEVDPDRGEPTAVREVERSVRLGHHGTLLRVARLAHAAATPPSLRLPS